MTPSVPHGSASFVDALRAWTGQEQIAVAPHDIDVPHGTTIVAMVYDSGVVMAGDRRATMGSYIAQRDIEKVFPADDWSLIGIAGSAGIAIELVRLFSVELEHYEKIEGTPLSLMGKANRLGQLIRANLPLAMQGLAAVPLFAGVVPEQNRGRVFSYDVTGGRYEEHDYHAVGSGSLFARGALKKLYRESASEDQAIRIALESLFDAAEDDSATGGPDTHRGIYPIVGVVDRMGVRFIPEERIAAFSHDMIRDRQSRPDGPAAAWERP